MILYILRLFRFAYLITYRQETEAQRELSHLEIAFRLFIPGDAAAPVFVMQCV
jgi:hypothetical protein